MPNLSLMLPQLALFSNVATTVMHFKSANDKYYDNYNIISNLPLNDCYSNSELHNINNAQWRRKCLLNIVSSTISAYMTTINPIVSVAVLMLSTICIASESRVLDKKFEAIIKNVNSKINDLKNKYSASEELPIYQH